MLDLRMRENLAGLVRRALAGVKQNRLARFLFRSAYRSMRTRWLILRGESRRSDQQTPVRAITDAQGHFSAGYYDNCPWDPAGRYLLCLTTDFARRQPRPLEPAWVSLVDLQSGQCRPLAATRAWCWQKGAMQGWVAPEGKPLIRYNDFRDGAYVTVLHDMDKGEVDVLPGATYVSHPDGRARLTVNFARLAFCRPGYGYAALPFDPRHSGDAPQDDGIWRYSSDTGRGELIISLAQLKQFEHREDFEDAIHHVISLSFNPGGDRFVFFHRWRSHKSGIEKTRMFTAGADGKDLCLLSDGDMVSHYCWQDRRGLLAWAHERPLGNRFYLYQDLTPRKQAFMEGVLTEDGHPSFHPSLPVVVLDSYPDGLNRQHLKLLDVSTGAVHPLGSFFAGAGFDGPARCDLHPRWSRDGRSICFDSSHEGRRMVYLADVERLLEKIASGGAGECQSPAWAPGGPTAQDLTMTRG